MNIIFEHLSEDYYELDIGNIWNFEREYFFKIERNLDFAEKLIMDIRTVLIGNVKPVFGTDFHDNGTETDKIYYNKLLDRFFENEKHAEKIFDLDYFFRITDYYSYSTGFIIRMDNVIESRFHYYFALKLRQYRYALDNTPSFLDYQLDRNFNNNKDSYIYFLNLLLLQYTDLFSKDLINTVNEYIEIQKKAIPLEVPQVRSFLLYNYELWGEEYFIKNANGFAQVFSELKTNYFIDPKTHREDFKRIFTLSKIKPEQRIKWIGRNIELKWFVQILIDDLEKVKSPVARRWETALYCFVNENGESFMKTETISKASGKMDEKKSLLKKILTNL